MKKYALFLFALLFGSSVLAAQPLLSAKELSAKISDANLRVIDIRPAKSYTDFHIEGAQSAPFEQWRGAADNPGQVPDASKVTALAQRLGLNANSHAVIASTGVDSIDFGTAAWVYWVLKEYGLKDISILNGGMKAWANAGGLLDDEVVKVPAGTWQPKRTAQWSADVAEVKQAATSGKASLLDARPEAFFAGETRHALVKLPGTIQGAANLSFEKWFVANSPNFAAFVTPDAAKTIAASITPKAGSTATIAFCNTGHWAAIDWFALSEVLGQKNIKLYSPSLVEYSKDSSAPLANVPSRAKQLMIDAKIWKDKS